MTTPFSTVLLPASRRARVGLLVGFWSAAALLVLGHSALVFWTVGAELDAGRMVHSLGTVLVWVGLTPLVAWVARRLPIDGPRRARHLAAHLLLATALHLAVIAALTAAVWAAFDVGPLRDILQRALLSSYLFTVLVYAGVVLAVHALGYAERALAYRAELREREVAAAQLAAQLARARLGALRTQLNPHFLFNTLHAVSTLMARDVGGARTMLADLSGLLRRALDDADEHEVPLDDELDFLDHYLRIERRRFGDRLCVEVDVPEALRAAYVPPLLLQPLVENALKHGLAPRAEGGRVRVAGRREGDALVLTIADDGRGLNGRPPAEGVGWRATRERLEGLYPGAGAFAWQAPAEGGLAVTVRLPFHTRPLTP